MVVGEGGLRASVESLAPGGNHDVFQEHAEIEPTADFEHPVNGEDHADGGVEELEIAPVLGVHLILLAPFDAEQAIKVPADLAAAAEIRLRELQGIVVVFPLGLSAAVVGLQDRRRQRRFRLAADDGDPPRLDVGAAGRAAGERQQFRHRFPGYRRRQEAPDRAPGSDRLFHGFGDVGVVGRCVQVSRFPWLGNPSADFTTAARRVPP